MSTLYTIRFTCPDRPGLVSRAFAKLVTKADFESWRTKRGDELMTLNCKCKNTHEIRASDCFISED